MKRLAILTSGGDAPGMNAAIRAAVRLASSRGIEPIGVMHGYQGLLNDDTVVLNPRSVSNTVQRGGTILKTSRCSEFESEAGRERAKKTLERRNIDGLIVIGGNGTLTGAIELGRIWRGQIIGLPGTIDNDLAGSDFTIGYDTAVTTALYGIDRIRDTAESHERVFLIEVMGRHAGFIALDVAIAGGAEEVLLPEVKTGFNELADRLMAGIARGKGSSIVIVAEGYDSGGAEAVAERLRSQRGLESRVLVLGHLQRGGSPTAADRLLGTELGAYAVDLFIGGTTGVMAGKVNGRLVATPLVEAVSLKKPLNRYMLSIMDALAS